MPVTAIRPKRVYQQIVEQIRDLIESNEFKPGDRLPPERELAKTLGVSRPSVREAMIALEGAKLIEVRTGDGTYVLERPKDQDFRAWLKEGLEPGPLAQYETRQIIEPALAAEAARRVTEDEVAMLERLVDHMERSFPDGAIADENAFEFHTTLADLSGNDILAALVHQLWAMRKSEMWQTVRARVVTKEHRAEAVKDRRSLLASLRARDPEGARASMERYLAHAKARYFDV